MEGVNEGGGGEMSEHTGMHLLELFFLDSL